MSAYQKVLAVMKDIKYLSKDDTVAFGNTNYKGLSEEKVTSAVRESMVANGLIVFPIAQVHHREPIGEKNSMLSTVDVTYRFVDTEDDTFFDAVSSGTGVDTQDKGVGKAMTYSYKYLFLRTFAIPTGEDPDKISSAELDAREADARMEKGKQTIRQMVEDNTGILDDDYLSTVTLDTDAADSVEKVTDIYRELNREVKKIRLAESKVRVAETMKNAGQLTEDLKAEAEKQKDPFKGMKKGIEIPATAGEKEEQLEIF